MPLRTVLLSFFLGFFFSLPPAAISQLSAQSAPDRAHYETPDLVIGIVVDQFRPDFIYRFWDKFGEDGIRRVVNRGFMFENADFGYNTTFTGPGHATVYTGTTPAVHGIIGNSWYDREMGRNVYVTEDSDVESVGTDGDEGKMSPRWMLPTTIGDELRLHTNFRSNVIGISLKDRGAILPGGHSGQAYWLEYATGRFITSTHYRDELPDWVKRFNRRGLVDDYLSRPWETLLPIGEYVESIEDDSPHEIPFRGQERPVFPHDLPALAEVNGPGLVASTPFGDELLFELARAAIEGESLGRGETPDLLAISFSSPDHIGHRFGSMSKEVQDTWLRFDRQLARFLNDLDRQFGRENYLIFITTDHGVGPIPEYLARYGIPGGHFSRSEARESLRSHLQEIYGENLVLSYINEQVFLDRDRIAAMGLDLDEIQKESARYLLSLDGVAGALTAGSLTFGEFAEGIAGRVQNGFNVRRSGDVAIWFEPQVSAATDPRGAHHHHPYKYDTHAPLIWYGWDVPAGRSAEPVFVRDIAPTLSIFLRTPFPSGTTGRPLNDYMRRAR